jgi:hypothetical protein
MFNAIKFWFDDAQLCSDDNIAIHPNDNNNVIIQPDEYNKCYHLAIWNIYAIIQKKRMIAPNVQDSIIIQPIDNTNVMGRGQHLERYSVIAITLRYVFALSYSV